MNGCGFVDNNTNPNTYYQNVRGLRTKLEEFYLGLSSCSTDLIAITETGFNESINDAEIVPSQYKILRSDRNDGRKQTRRLVSYGHTALPAATSTYTGGREHR